MAQIRTATDAGLGNVRTSPMPNVAAQEQRISIPTGYGGLPGGETAGQVGKGLNDLSNGLEKLQVEQDALVASKLDEDYQREVMQSAYDPDTGFFAQTGINAVGLPKAADQRLTEIRQKYAEQAGNPRVQQLFNKAASRTQQTTLEAVMRHTITQQDKYRDERADSTIKLGTEKIALDPENDKTFQDTLGTMSSAALAKARVDGASPEKVNLMLYETGSLAYATKAAQLMQSDDPQKIIAGNEFFKQAQLGGKLTLDHVNKLDALQKAAVPKALATSAIGQVRAATSQAFSGMTMEQVIDGGILPQESGGKRYGGKGSVAGPGELTTSPAGAKGEYQVMDKTNRDPGYGVTPAKDNSPEERARVGREYALALNNHYEDKTLALMAYNGGPGDVDDHIAKVGDPRTGAISMNQFIASFPKSETRNYVTSIQRRLGVGSGKIDAGIAMAKATELDKQVPGSGELFLGLYEKNNKVAEEAEKEYALNIKQKFSEQMANSNGDVTAVDNYTAGEAKRLGLYDDLTKYDGTTNSTALMNLRELPDEKFASVDLREYSNSLSRSDWMREQERQKVIRSGDNEYKSFTSKGENYWLTIAGGDGNKATPEKAQFKIRADEYFQKFKQDNKRGPNEDEARKIFQTLTTQPDSGPRVYKLEANAEYSVEGVPKGELPYYRAALEQLGFDATSDNINTMFKNPAGFFGDMPDVPKEQVRNMVNKLAHVGVPVTAANIRSLYQRSIKDKIVAPAPATPDLATALVKPLASADNFQYGGD